MESEWIKASSGDIKKLQKAGDSIEGFFLGYESSPTFKDSYIVKISDENKQIKAVFVSGIVVGLIRDNQIELGKKIRIVYKGKKPNRAKTKEYNDYEVYYCK